MEYIIIVIGFLCCLVAASNAYVQRSMLSLGEAVTLGWISSLYTYWSIFDVALSSRAFYGRWAFFMLLVVFLLRLIDVRRRENGYVVK